MRGFVLLSVVVGAAIGVGVAVEAAVPPPVYGAPALRFTAAFAIALSLVRIREGRNVVEEYDAVVGQVRESARLVERIGPPPTLRQQLEGERRLCQLAFGRSCGWVAYSPLTGTDNPRSCQAGNLTERRADVNGLRTTLDYDTAGCGFAVGQLTAVRGNWTLSVAVSSSVGVAPVRVFLDTVRVLT